MQVVNKYKDTDKERQFYVGRGSPFGNPFPMETFRNDRNIVVDLHRLRFMEQLFAKDPVIKILESIDPSNNLACYCAPAACHADVYLEYLTLYRGYGGEMARSMLLSKYGYQSPPQREGIDHINIYTRSSTRLGKLASNMGPVSFVHPDHGYFKTMEHFWYWLGTGKTESLREIENPFNVKAAGKTLPKVFVENFPEQIETAIRLKVAQSEELTRLLKENTLPFAHYYYYGTAENCVVRKAGTDRFLQDLFTKISHELNPPIKLLVAGSRDFSDYRAMRKHICDLKVNISEIIEGGAKGADTLGYWYGLMNHIPVHSELVTDEEWKKSKGAGMQRNIRMGEMCDQGLVIIVNKSKGSTHMAEYLKRTGKPVTAIHI